MSGDVRSLPADAALRASERRLRTLVETAGSAILVLRPDGTVAEWNEAAAVLFGVARDDAIGVDYVERFVPADQRAAVRDDVARVLAGARTVGFENEIVRGDGTRRTVSWNVTRVLDEHDATVGLTAIGQDVTSLRASEAQFRALFEQSPDACFLCDEHVVLECNQAAVRLFRAPDASWLVGHHLSERSPARQPDGRPSADKQREVHAIWRTAGSHRFDWLHERADGEPLPVEVFVTRLYTGERGVRALVTLHDLTERRRAEEALAASEERLRYALDASEDGLWDWNVATGDVFYSPRILRMLGHEPGDLEPHVRSWEERLHPEDAPRVLAVLQAHLDGLTPMYESEFRLRTRDGRWLWTVGRGKVVDRDAAGRPLRMVGSNRDIGARKEVEEDQRFLFELGAALQQLASPDDVGALATARVGAHFGVARCRWITVDAPRDAYVVAHEYRSVRAGEWHDPSTADDAPPFWVPACRDALARGEIVALGDLAGSPRGRGAPPGFRAMLLVPLRREGRWLAVLELLDDGERAWPVRERTLARAAAERVWPAHEAMRHMADADLQRRRLQAVLDALPVGVVIADATGRVTTMTEPARRILRTDDLRTGPYLWRFDPRWRDTGAPIGDAEWPLESALRGRATHGREIDVRRGGDTMTVLASAAPVRDASGAVTGAVLVVLDQTERVQLETRLRQAQKLEAIGQLAGGIAHDFNNLLTVITGNLDFAMSEVADVLPSDHAALDDLAEIGRAADRARTLVRQLLAFSRKQVLRVRPVDVNEVVRGAERLLHRVIGEEIVLETRLADRIGLVRADAGQLEQVLLNLVLNARDAMLTPAHGHAGAGGTLTIETAPVTLWPRDTVDWSPLAAGAYVRLTVRDTGHGMDEATRAHAFEPFFTTKPVGTGTGLGLATVYGIVAQLGGAVRVESARGAGTSMTILLPRLVEPETVEASTDGADAPAARGTVLLAEDEDAVRATVRRQLEQGGYTVLEAGAGADALQLWRDRAADVDVVVTDLRMPRTGGRELVASIRAERPRLPAVFISGYADERAPEETDAGDPIVEKPFDAAALLAAVGRALAG